MTYTNRDPDPQWRAEARELWTNTLKICLLTPDSLATLEMACHSLNQFLECEETLRRDGLTFNTKTGLLKKHPCVEIQKAAGARFLAAVRVLGIEIPEKLRKGPGRPMAY